MLKIDIKPTWSENEQHSGVFSLRASIDQIIAATLANGKIALHSATTGRLSYLLTHSEAENAVTAVRFSPTVPKTFISISADGIIKEWVKKNPELSWSFKEEDNELYALDISTDGKTFSTGGSDKIVRLYDFETKKEIHQFSRLKFDQTSPKGHSNRIYAIQYHPTDVNYLISGGWDNTVQIWDLRIQDSVGALPGPHICAGDAMDINGSLLLTGSWRTHDQIQIFDLRTQENLKTIRFSLAGDDKQCSLYTAKFLPGGKNFIVGGSGNNQIKTFSMDSFSSTGSPLTFDSGVFTCCIMKDGKALAIGTQSGGVHYHKIAKIA